MGCRGGSRITSFFPPQWNPFGKRIDLTFPAAAVESHPGMAWIPSRPWIHDRDVKPRKPLRPFWIDLEPVTVADYRPRVERWLAQDKIQLDESMLLMSEQRRRGLENVGLGQVQSLGRNLADIFKVVEEANVIFSGQASFTPVCAGLRQSTITG
jgi:hypothetical protein